MFEMLERANTWILVLIAFTIFRDTSLSDLHFSVHNVTQNVCVDVQIGTVIDKHRPIGGKLPWKYSLGDGSTLFEIDETNGGIMVTRALTEVNASRLVISKHVNDALGSRADIVINLVLARPIITAKACPKIQELRVREIAPVGEEIGLVECTSNINDTVLLNMQTPLSVTSRGVSSANVPFNITSKGVVVVAKPLVYMNNIQDIQIINVTFMYNKDGGDPLTNCDRIETKVTIKIIVEKTDCHANWTYDVKKNYQLNVAPVATILNSTPDDCMTVCSTNLSLMCHCFNYNAVKKECLFLNETEYTQTNMTKSRMGMLLYRKFCDSERLPLIYLRQTEEKIENVTSLTMNASKELLGKLLYAGNHITNTSVQNAVMATILFLDIVDKTKLHLYNASTPQLEIFLKLCGQNFDMLLSKAENFHVSKKGNFSPLLNVYDTLIDALSRLDKDQSKPITVQSNKTAFSIQNMPPNQSLTSEIRSRTSTSDIHLIFSSQNTSEGNCNKATLVAGTIGGLEDIITPILVGNRKDRERLALEGLVVSVIMKPAIYDQFEVLLDISTSQVREKDFARICGFMKTGMNRQSASKWDTDGCWLVDYNNSHTRCRCSHLTNFAVLMQVKMFQIEQVHVVSLEILTKIGCCVSIAALSTTVAVLLWLRLRSERYYLLLHLSVAVITAQVVFLLGIDAVKFKITCRFVAILLHYLYLSVFTLMLAEGIHLFHKLHRAFDTDDNFNMLLVLGWGSPFIIVSLSLISAGDGYSTEQHCWLSTEGAIWAFVGPALTVITINLAILIMIIRTFLGVTIVAKKTDLQKFKASLKATVVLLPLLGITWMFGVVAVNESTVVFQYIFAVLNSLQGLFIFLFHVVFNEDVKKACSFRRRNQISSVDLCRQSLTKKKPHKKANLYSATTSL